MIFHSQTPSVYEETPVDFPDDALRQVREILKARRNFDIGSYKEKYLKRRIAIRVRATHSETAYVYCDLLARNERELDILLDGLTINVSQFFRNGTTFEKLRVDILPALFARLRREGRSRTTFWSAGCAGGEEPYSLAIILKDSFPEELKEFKISLVATDIDERILDAARTGVYGPERLAEVAGGVRERYFSPAGDRSRLDPAVKEMVEFRRNDLFDFRSYIESDLILCRNVLIYFERGEQVRILHEFASSLHTGGVLVLGKAETVVGEVRQRFTTLCPMERIYQKSRLTAY